MAGDHKCPVCFATFTRPQHVARHMRSHTGDRPYKCQHCGDQFARSDLLSRHVKKCHANESAPRAANYRRKGNSAVTRATTSKQACDQCVEALLPCDGANPCSKCIQRDCQCTFVKFHRQTAPIGPGHNNRSVASFPSQSLTLPSLAATDDFLFAQQRAPGHSLFSSGSFLPSVYSTSQQTSSSYLPAFIDQATSSAPTWLTSQEQQQQLSTDAMGRRYSLSSSQFGDSDVSSSIPSSASSSSVHLPISQVIHHPEQDYRASYPITSQTDTQPQRQPPPAEGGFSSAFGLMSLDDPAVLAGEATDAQPFFWNVSDTVFPPPPQSATLDKYPSSRPPLVQRPSTSSGIPYAGSFTPSSNRTPTASREAETRELRDFWKAYLRTPLSGSFMSTPQAEHQQQTVTASHPKPTDSAGYKRQRVSSLPSVKTPGPSVISQPGGNVSSVRPTLHGSPDDLRSYEAAVLARKAPVNLHIVPKRKQTQSHPAPPAIEPSKGSPPGQVPSHLQMPWTEGSRPGSSTENTSSLANALYSPSSSSAGSFSREGSSGVY